VGRSDGAGSDRRARTGKGRVHGQGVGPLPTVNTSNAPVIQPVRSQAGAERRDVHAEAAVEALAGWEEADINVGRDAEAGRTAYTMRSNEGRMRTSPRV
jgi:hypothetical protein